VRLPRRLLLLCLVAACGGGQGAGSDTAGAGPRDRAAPAPQSDTLLVLEQEGGIAGAHSELTLFRTGEVTLAQDPAPGGIPVRRWTVAQTDYDAIAALLESAEFRALGAEYLPDDTCCDRITYTLTIPGPDGRTVRTMDGARQPEPLAALLERLRALEATAPQ
jgi:hypothetical protein